MLLLLQHGGREAIDTVLQLWYSAKLTYQQFCYILDTFKEKLKEDKGMLLKKMIPFLNKIHLNSLCTMQN